MADVYCDNSECIYNCEDECQKTSIVIKRHMFTRGLLYCASRDETKKPLPVGETEQEQKQISQVDYTIKS